MPFDAKRWVTLRSDSAFAARLGDVYRERRKRLGSQRSFGPANGIHPKAVERIEQGKIAEISPELFRQLARALGYSPEELIRRAQPGSILPAAAEGPEGSDLIFLRRQEAEILNVPLLPGGGASFRFVWPDLVFAAPVSFRRRPKAATTDDIDLSDPSITSTAIIGVPGGGKSTTLRLIALRLMSEFVGGGGRPLPVLMHARDVQREYEQGSGTLSLLEANRPIARLVDGLDEVAEDDRMAALQYLQHSADPGDITVVTCRSDVFAHLERKAPAGLPFDEVVEVLEWDFERNVLPFAQGYLEKVGKCGLLPTFREACHHYRNLQRFVCNPFHLALVLYLLLSDQALREELFVDRFGLYDAFYRQWVRRERSRGTSKISGERMVSIHVEVARSLYGRRFGHTTICIGAILGVNADAIDDTAFTGLFQWRYDELADEDRLIGFRHETLLEFILAFGLLESMKTGRGLEEALLTQYNNDVNMFVREGFTRLDRVDRASVEGRLSSLLGTDALDSRTPEEALRVREQAVYYLGRLGTPRCPPALIRLAEEAREPMLRRAAALGAILYGEEEVEKSFIDELLSSAKADLMNRSVQLVYFGDVEEEMFAFEDDGTAEWKGVKAAILERLAGTTIRDKQLRLWDLATLRSFLLSRTTDILLDEELAIVQACAEVGCEAPLRLRQQAELAVNIVDIVARR